MTGLYPREKIPLPPGGLRLFFSTLAVVLVPGEALKQFHYENYLPEPRGTTLISKIVGHCLPVTKSRSCCAS